MRNRIVLALVFVLVLGVTVFAFAWQARQPHMRAALEHLQQAQEQLKMAEDDKGGHRVKAEQHVQQAINEVNAGIQYDNTHERGRDRH